MSKKDAAANAKANTPDIGQIETRDLKEVRFPARLTGEYRVYLSPHAAGRMKQHAGGTSEVELCGVLVGEVCKDSAGPYLSVSDVIEGQNANNYGSQVTFTHDTWAHINAVMDKEHPGKRIVGWYHTHPGFGIFLSGMDSFIQDNFFNQPYQVAIVIETRQKQMGCFAWVGGKSAPLRRLWIGDEEVQLTTGEAEPFKPDTVKESPGETRRPQEESEEPFKFGWRLSTVLFLIVACLIGWLLGRFMSAADMQRVAAESVQSEIYSILEFAGLNTMAGRDFQEVGDSLKKAEELLKEGKSDDALQELQRAESMSRTFKATYDKDRTRFRNDLAAIAARRGNLAQDIAEMRVRQGVVESYVAQLTGELYIMRISQILSAAGTMDVSQLTPAQQSELKVCLDRVLAINPAAKSQIVQVLPGVIEFFYSPGTAPKPDAGKAADSTTVDPAK